MRASSYPSTLLLCLRDDWHATFFRETETGCGVASGVYNSPVNFRPPPQEPSPKSLKNTSVGARLQEKSTSFESNQRPEEGCSSGNQIGCGDYLGFLVSARGLRQCRPCGCLFRIGHRICRGGSGIRIDGVDHGLCRRRYFRVSSQLRPFIWTMGGKAFPGKRSGRLRPSQPIR